MQSVCRLCARPLVLLAITTIALIALGITDVTTAVIVIALALMQNVVYSIQSRARLRSSDMYHAIAAIGATAAFFVSIKFLITHRMTIDLLAPYTLATVAGNLWGKRISEWIEDAIGAVAHLGATRDSKHAQQVIPLRSALLALAILFVVQTIYNNATNTPTNPHAIVIIITAAFGGSFFFSALQAARNTNAYWSHLVFIILQSIAGIATYTVLLDAVGDWSIFAPYVLGSVVGSITGARSGKRIEAWLGSSWDAHIAEGKTPTLPYLPTAVIVLLILPQAILFGPESFTFAAIALFSSAALQHGAFTIISRARNRNNDRYLEWASVFSNGIWFLTLSMFVMNSLTPTLYLPYITGCAIGSLWGQGIALRIERVIGAIMGITAGAKAG